MYELVIGGVLILTSLIVVRVIKKSAKDAYSQQHSENFPFPKQAPSIEDEDDDDWLGRSRPDELVIVEQSKANSNTPHQMALAKEMSKVAPKTMAARTNTTNKKQDDGASEFNFELEKAIIYSEIMQPKYTEY